MIKPQAGIPVFAGFLMGLHFGTAAQPNAEFQIIAQTGANPPPLVPNTVNVLKADVAARSPSAAESSPKGMWIQNWSDPQQAFAWKVHTPKADKYLVDVLISGAPGSQIEID